MECDSSTCEGVIVQDAETISAADIFVKIESLEKKVLAVEDKLDKILHILEHSPSPSNACPRVEQNNVDNDQIRNFEKIRNLTDLLAFEKKLKNNEYKMQLHHFIDAKFKNMEKYDKCYRKFAYDVIDTFCKRSLFTIFSWSGKKSHGGNNNLPLKDNIVFINFIFGCIQNKMPDFGFAQLENIFSILCRNKNSNKNETGNN